MNKFKYGLLAASALCASSLIVMPGPAFARDRSDVNVSISLGNAAFGYSDGYYNQDRSWHSWQNDDERNWYRENHGTTYYDMGRSQDNDRSRGDWRDGRRADWRGDSGGTDFSVSLGNVEFGYNDGYYDRSRQWHNWNNNGERDWYQRNRVASYNDMRRQDDRDQYRQDWRDGRRQDWRRVSGGGTDFSISLGGVAFGYNDGYYDRSRQWHNWSNDGERDWYQRNRVASYNDMRRDDDRDQYRHDWRDGRRQDWRRDGGGGTDFSVSLGNVEFGYNDGYYDRSRQWHSWSNDGERDWYRRNRVATYNDMRREDDRDQYRVDWRDGRRNGWRVGGDGQVGFSFILGHAVIGYSDGYYDDGRNWHAWRNVNERTWYRRNRGRDYYNVTHDRERNRHRRDWRDGRSQDWRDGGEHN